ncbi:unnamed protein product [Cyprideis torosa]|uniref:Uncharacterized protein n=1 Tax=Cyprideis torosa TaxID=163714 RepID=A0A7R8WDR9_9CRUS|nr:unnamed protein product [Cyprideis torosa]CAG0889904.1 unnamed protein product [Cyprideis torosa]
MNDMQIDRPLRNGRGTGLASPVAGGAFAYHPPISLKAAIGWCSHPVKVTAASKTILSCSCFLRMSIKLIGQSGQLLTQSVVSKRRSSLTLNTRNFFGYIKNKLLAPALGSTEEEPGKSVVQDDAKKKDVADGGKGYSLMERCRIAEVCGSFGHTDLAHFLSVQSDLAAEVLKVYSAEEQRERYLSKLATGELQAAWCLDDEGGSDVEFLRTIAHGIVPEEENETGHYILNGRKKFVASLGSPNIFFVFALTEMVNEYKNQAMLPIVCIVEKDSPGVEILPDRTVSVGLHSTKFHEVVFNNVHVPLENLVGVGETNAFHIRFHGTAVAGVTSLASTAGFIKWTIQEVLPYIHSTKVVKSKMADHAFVEHYLTQMSILAYTAESMAYLTAGLTDSKEFQDVLMESVICQIYSSEALYKTADMLNQLVGKQTAFQDGDGKFGRIYRDCLQQSAMIEDTILKMFVALHGIQHVGIKHGSHLEKLRHPLQNPKEVIKYNISALKAPFFRFNKHPKLRDNIFGSLHPSLKKSADEVERLCILFEKAIEMCVLYNSVATIQEHYCLMRMSEVATYLFGMCAVMARASRSYCIGLQDADYDMFLADLVVRQWKYDVEARLLKPLFGVKHMTPRLPQSVLVGSSGVQPFATGVSTPPAVRAAPNPIGHPTKKSPYVTDLPRLPVPPLESTLKKFLKTVRPHVDEDEFQTTEKLVAEFGRPGGIGQELQVMLEQRARQTENWLADWWLNTAYLEQRGPVVVTSSPGILLPAMKFERVEDQLWAAAGAAAAIVEFTDLVNQQLIPQERQGKFPLDMSQYGKVFCTMRVPGVTRDKMLSFGEERPTHIIVAHNNHFFRVEVYGENRQPLSHMQLYDQLLQVVAQSREKTLPLGVLTSDERSRWGQNYEILMNDFTNSIKLDVMNKAKFLLCLDGPNRVMPENAPDERTAAALQMIHGCGVQGNAGNRWFDKTVQLIVGREGQIGVTYEHTPAEGPPIATLCDFITDRMIEGEQRGTLNAVLLKEGPERLDFEVPSNLLLAMKEAESALERMVDDLEMTAYVFPHYGKNYIKSLGLSPDSYIQMALQLAFFKIHAEPGAAYESASTRRYVGGRTETIRSCSPESVLFCQAMEAKSGSDKEKFESLKRAVNAHKEYVSEAVAGYGVDRHLLGLKLVALDAGMNLPPLYMDAGYIRSAYFRLSTSQVPSRFDTVMFFGPMFPDGYAICYNPREDCINLGLSSFKSCPETFSREFRNQLEKSLLQMRDISLSYSKAKL